MQDGDLNLYLKEIKKINLAVFLCTVQSYSNDVGWYKEKYSLCKLNNLKQIFNYTHLPRLAKRAPKPLLERDDWIAVQGTWNKKYLL